MGGMLRPCFRTEQRASKWFYFWGGVRWGGGRLIGHNFTLIHLIRGFWKAGSYTAPVGKQAEELHAPGGWRDGSGWFRSMAGASLWTRQFSLPSSQRNHALNEAAGQDCAVITVSHFVDADKHGARRGEDAAVFLYQNCIKLP